MWADAEHQGDKCLLLGFSDILEGAVDYLRSTGRTSSMSSTIVFFKNAGLHRDRCELFR